MRRRSAQISSSLDLFLDTISNMFGGIVLLAILLALIVQTRSQRPVELDDNQVNMSVEEADAIVQELERLRIDFGELTDAIAILEERKIDPRESELHALQIEVERRASEADESVRTRLDLSEELARQEASTATLREEISNIQQELVSAQSSLQVEQKAVDEALDESLITLQLPEVGTVSKPNIILLLRFGKVYAAYQTDGTTPNREHVRMTVSSSSSAVEISPKVTGGWDMSQSIDSAELHKFLDAQSPGYNILSVAVWPDSFREFSQLRQIALNKGFQYQLWPLTDVPSLIVSNSVDQLNRVQ